MSRPCISFVLLTINKNYKIPLRIIVALQKNLRLTNIIAIVVGHSYWAQFRANFIKNQNMFYKTVTNKIKDLTKSIVVKTWNILHFKSYSEDLIARTKTFNDSILKFPFVWFVINTLKPRLSGSQSVGTLNYLL